ncbi:MAG TPA: hypothetical protein VHX60_04380 [Acidobacteriaceae bacterium]|jgi:hypothetical protein|nr:hypothetical protein [Acidobacteriaceae bacterium]
MPHPIVPCLSAAALLAAWSLTLPARAQDSDFKLDLHANAHATAKDIGLPEYPGAAPWRDKDSDSSSADLGFALNGFRISIQAAQYITADSPAQVVAFYRKPLAKYGEVLECDHGKPVGSLTQTKSGLTCGGNDHGHLDVNGSGDADHELRAGSPEHFRIVGIDTTAAGKTKFGLVSLVLPKEDAK